MLTKNLKKSALTVFGVLAFTASTMYITSCNKSSASSGTCENIPVECSKTPFTYKACVDGDNAWYELNGAKYTDVNKATQAVLTYCGSGSDTYTDDTSEDDSYEGDY